MSRVIDLPGAINFRDFGGYETRDGAKVRYGSLYRCGQLSELADAGHQLFAELGIEVICDLRRADERDNEPTAIPHDVARRVEIPMDPGSASQLRDSLADGSLDVAARAAWMREITCELARDHAGGYGVMFSALLTHAPGGFLVHCTAGKDRTGVAAALVLLALGVPREAVVADYLLTNQVIDFEKFILPRIRRNVGHDDVDVEAARALSGVRAEYLNAAIDEMARLAGSVDGYLEQVVGVDDSSRETLRNHYLE